jgi:hypothetical protein
MSNPKVVVMTDGIVLAHVILAFAAAAFAILVM